MPLSDCSITSLHAPQKIGSFERMYYIYSYNCTQMFRLRRLLNLKVVHDLLYKLKYMIILYNCRLVVVMVVLTTNG